MIRISFFFGEFLLLGLWLLARILVYLRQGSIRPIRELQLLLMLLNLAVILRFAFYPFRPVDGVIQPLLFDAGRVLPLRVNLRPFVRLPDYVDRGEMMINILGNIGLFIPGGILYPLLYRRLDRFWKVLGAGMLLSLTIELLQLPFFVRTTDIDDFIQNSLGCAIGYGIYALVRAVCRRKPKPE